MQTSLTQWLPNSATISGTFGSVHVHRSSTGLAGSTSTPSMATPKTRISRGTSRSRNRARPVGVPSAPRRRANRGRRDGERHHAPQRHGRDAAHPGCDPRRSPESMRLEVERRHEVQGGLDLVGVQLGGLGRFRQVHHVFDAGDEVEVVVTEGRVTAVEFHRDGVCEASRRSPVGSCHPRRSRKHEPVALRIRSSSERRRGARRG